MLIFKLSKYNVLPVSPMKVIKNLEYEVLGFSSLLITMDCSAG